MIEVTSGCRRAGGMRPVRMTADSSSLDGVGAKARNGTTVRGAGARQMDEPA
jgi:hypothetical protein